MDIALWYVEAWFLFLVTYTVLEGAAGFFKKNGHRKREFFSRILVSAISCFMLAAWVLAARFEHVLMLPESIPVYRIPLFVSMWALIVPNAMFLMRAFAELKSFFKKA